ncbi:transposase domain-containing protein [Membranihabitans marinus]|nr:transposase domain-containing protein [Membranihabitans marinus]
MMYSFFATCKANEVNPYEWLKVTLDKIPDYPVNRLNELLPTKIAIKEESA